MSPPFLLLCCQVVWKVFPPSFRSWATGLLLFTSGNNSGDGWTLGRCPLGADDLAVPHHQPHHDPSHVWILAGHFWDLHDHPGQNLGGSDTRLCFMSLTDRRALSYADTSVLGHEFILSVLLHSGPLWICRRQIQMKEHSSPPHLMVSKIHACFRGTPTTISWCHILYCETWALGKAMCPLQ